MHAIKLQDIKKEFTDRVLFEADSLMIKRSERIGIVGRNGQGKSTLLKMIIGEDNGYDGEIESHGRIEYVPQIKETSTMSGGEQSMTLIQKAIHSHPDILMLDEPTSNLDVENLNLLIKWLKEYSATLIFVSHDRYLLNELVDNIWEIDRGKIYTYSGNYDDFQTMKQLKSKQQEVAYSEYQRKIKQLESEAQRRFEKASTFKKQKKNVSTSDYKVNSYAGKYDAQEKAMAKSAKALEKRIKKLNHVEAPVKERSFVFKEVGHLHRNASTLINLNEGKLFFENIYLFSYPPFKVTFGDKLSISGPNQAGKTSFLRAILSQTLKGYYSQHLNIGYFSQNFNVLDLNESLYNNVRKGSLQTDFVIKNILASLGFDNKVIYQKANVLSGGERVRLSFAKILLGNHNLLLLDEPTNYLDIDTLESIEGYIKNYPGSVILVSHDQTFVEATTNQHYFIDGGQLLSPVYREKNKNQVEQELLLLQFQLDEMIMKPEMQLEDIREIQRKIEKLRNNAS
ncbi:ribosomal protection-like ABC-F family protein [Vaginisenegalia massiliensis]|uniref:ribosomal protection-like ABC-F family protein n=1 Tax=Vaginisenegalia massiliensis TaxID=2058294 RepID=UPI000F53FD84|nr:ABC-F family ATP-binding cassette domain-containing protein [Vaginisenegalia massiliensis]